MSSPCIVRSRGDGSAYNAVVGVLQHIGGVGMTNIADFAEERFERRIDELRSKIGASRLAEADRPHFARNLGRIFEQASPARPQRLIRDVFEIAELDANALKNRQRFVRLKGEPLPLTHCKGIYNADSAKVLRIAKALEGLVCGSLKERAALYRQLVAQTTYASTDLPRPLHGASERREILRDLQEVARRIALQTQLGEYFDRLQGSSFKVTRDPSGQARFALGEDRINFDDRSGLGELLPHIDVGDYYIPLACLSVDLSGKGPATRFEGKSTQILRLAAKRFGVTPPEWWEDDDTGGPPTAEDPWSLRTYVHTMDGGHYETGASAAFWGSAHIEECAEDGVFAVGRAWRRMYCRGQLRLTLVPDRAGCAMAIGLHASDYGIIDNGGHWQPAIMPPITKSSAPCSFVFSRGETLFLFRYAYADMLCDDSENACWASSGVALNDEVASAILFAPLGDAKDGGLTGARSAIRSGPRAFFPGFESYDQRISPCQGTIAGMLCRHFSFSESGGIEAELTQRSHALVTALDDFILAGRREYDAAKQRKSSNVAARGRRIKR